MSAGLLVSGLSMAVFGFWARIWPDSFAAFTGFDVHTHYLHDAGVFQIGIGTALLLSLVVDDAVTVALAAFVVAGTLHTVNHGIDLHLGGDVAAVYGLRALSLIGAIALIAHLLTLRRSEGSPDPTRRQRRFDAREPKRAQRIGESVCLVPVDTNGHPRSRPQSQ